MVRLTNRRFPAWLLLGAVLVAHEMYFFRYTVDEAYISARYARNLREGLGPVFNPGERVEGFTNLLLVLLQAVVPHNGESVMVFTKILCMACSLASLWLLLGLASATGNNSGIAPVLGGLLFVANGAVAVSAVTGLETHLFCAIVTGGIVAYLRGGRRGAVLSSVLMGLACLVRPEGFLFSGITFVHLSVRQRSLAWTWVLPWLMIVLPMQLWRKAYYGQWVPNTYFAKTGGGFHQIGRGIGYVKSFVNEYGRIGFFFFAAVPFLIARIGWRRSYQLSVLAPYLAYVVYTGGDWIPHFRLLVPVMPVIFVLAGEGAAAIAVFVMDSVAVWRTARALVLILLLALLLFDVANQSYYLRMGTELWTDGYGHAHRWIADWLRHETPIEASVALMDIGIVSYFSRRTIIDITGLTEPWIARSPGGWLKKEYRVSRLLALKPMYVVLVSRGDITQGAFASSFPIDQRIHDDPLFQREYRLLFSRDAFYRKEPHDFGYYLNVFGRR